MNSFKSHQNIIAFLLATEYRNSVFGIAKIQVSVVTYTAFYYCYFNY